MIGRNTVTARLLVALLAAAVGCAVLAACGGGGSSDSDSGGSTGGGTGTSASSGNSGGGATIPVTFVGDKTGLVGYLGKEIEEGIVLAMEQANESGELHGNKIELSVDDTTSEVSVATTKMAEAAKSDAVAIFGPTLSAEALALAPIAQQSQVPFFTMSEATNLVSIGNYIFRIQPASAHFYSLVLGHLAGMGVKTVNIVYHSDNPALSEQAKAMPAQLAKLGIEVNELIGIPSTTSDFSSVTTRLLQGEPDAIGFWTSGSSLPSLASALRNQGYKGQLFADIAATGGVLKPAGSAANGLLYPVGYATELPYPSSKKFTKLWEEAHPGTQPSGFGAIGYDEMTAFAKAMGLSGGASREDVLTGMRELASSGGFEGSSGPTIFIEPGDRDVSAPGAVVEWKDGKEHLVVTGEPGIENQPLKPN